MQLSELPLFGKTFMLAAGREIGDFLEIHDPLS